MRGEFNRASTGRGSQSLRGSFNRSGGSGISMAQHAKVMRASDLVRARVEAHHSANKARWVSGRYGDMLGKAGNTPRPAPLGLTNDPKAAMMERATREIDHKRVQRLARVEKATTNMLAGSRLRATRKMNWGVGLGD